MIRTCRATPTMPALFAAAAITGSKFGDDKNSDCIRAWLNDANQGAAHKTALQGWLTTQAPQVGISRFLNGNEFKPLRDKAMTDTALKIPPCP